ncbi:hypothetical protein [Tuberibacillus sp. Marseille-P3662]|uniref:hypothetical protein n=1 Tax=Tuberibacillus sp. Marseille-P3662 TaxID=1965358 RepID=UPI000A1CD5C8|nr:hypothetical protein [Tuberibacillus sp. Marseille-P3662]
MEETQSNQSANQAQNDPTMENVYNMSQTATNSLVKSLFRKHGVSKEHIQPIDDEQKEELRNMVRQIQEQVAELQTNQTTTEKEETKAPKKESPLSLMRKKRNRR